ncbi:MAG: beta-lactamase family protein [Chlorobi bacterium]|nr:beta-lactamase family protein [Chlorobiota bacterium]
MESIYCQYNIPESSTIMLIFKKITVSLMLYLFVACTNSQPVNSGLNDFIQVKYNKNQPLDSFALAIQKHYQLPGLAVATIHKSEISEIAVVGKNKTKNGVLLNSDSKFQIASCTKSFTALLTATFVDEGIINWNTKISGVFKEMIIHKDYQDITIKQVLTHTAGLPQFWTDDEVFNILNIIPEMQGSITRQRRIFAEWNLTHSAAFTSGEHHYSNGGYVIIAAMLEKLTGKSYEELMDERIFKQLKLNSAEFGYPFLHDSIQPYRHMNRNDTGVGITMDKQSRIPSPVFNPAGFISLSINDFAKYVLFYTRVLKGEKSIINHSVVQELFKPVVRDESNHEIAMGWQIIYVNNKKTYGHTGSDGTIRSAMSINPESGNAVVFVTNIGDQQSELALINVVVELINL